MRVVVDSAWIGGIEARGAAIEVREGRVAAVERAAPPGRGLHALPGFVNAHAHLELSSVRGEALARSTFAHWLEQILEARRGRQEVAIAAAVRAGAAELLSTGTVAVGDVDPTGVAWRALRETPLEGVVYQELLGAPPEPWLEDLERGLEASAAAHESRARLRLGVSPHAPYSAGEALFRRAFSWARALGIPVASHVAETDEEEELLAADAGPLAELFGRLGFSRPAWSDRRARSFRRVEALDPPPGFVVVHGGRLTSEELRSCAARGWPLVCCPRSHRWFGRPRHPAAHFLVLGGTLALGTDSRASNEALDAWGEMACLRAADADLSDDAILAAATSGGRRALGLDPAELRAGEPATFQLVQARDERPLPPWRLAAAAVRGELATRFVFVRGRLVFGDAAALAPA